MEISLPYTAPKRDKVGARKMHDSIKNVQPFYALFPQ